MLIGPRSVLSRVVRTKDQVVDARAVPEAFQNADQLPECIEGRVDENGSHQEGRSRARNARHRRGGWGDCVAQDQGLRQSQFLQRWRRFIEVARKAGSRRLPKVVPKEASRIGGSERGRRQPLRSSHGCARDRPPMKRVLPVRLCSRRFPAKWVIVAGIRLPGSVG
jgi:hypothetical protein